MLLALVAVVIGTPILWAISVGAVREVRRARLQDPRAGCQAWVVVPGMRARRYRCSEPLAPGGTWCRRHEVAEARGLLDADHDPDAALVDEPQAVGRALVQARLGIPLGLAAIAATAALTVWLVVR